MSLVQLLRLGLAAFDRRLRSLTEPRQDGDDALWVIMDRSLAGRFVVAVSRGLDGAAPASRAAYPVRQMIAAWSVMSPAVQMRTVGATALIASVVHIAMQLTARPVGWWWLIVPGIVAMFGAAAITIAAFAPPTEGRR